MPGSGGGASARVCVRVYVGGERKQLGGRRAVDRHAKADVASSG